jgi:phenylacetate-coenzyme A ligase PaaK-like adenylate-forming protein
MRTTPLEAWIGNRINATGESHLTRQLLERYQMKKLREVVSRVTEKSPFYRSLFAGTDVRDITDTEALARLPFTTPSDIRGQAMQMLCTSQDEIERVVTLQTSGTTGEAKRLFFTAEDLELTVDFFRHGMSTMVDSGATVIIFLPGEKPDSVGDLLARGLRRSGVTPVIHGPVRDIAAARLEISRHPSSCLVGIPTQILSLARGDSAGVIPKGWVESVLLSTDYVSSAIMEELKKRWGCKVFAHYGLTETGLGGGVECDAGDGYHLREADLFTEIVDTVTGLPVEVGKSGEVVFTTLTRQGMPLVRYRTGDRARFIPGPCPCGSILPRLGPVLGRIETEVVLRSGERLSMRMLDEALFPIAGVLNFSAEINESSGQDSLHLCFQVCEGYKELVAGEVAAALTRAGTTPPLFRRKTLAVGSITFDSAGWFTSGTAKRQINDNRQRQIEI